MPKSRKASNKKTHNRKNKIMKTRKRQKQRKQQKKYLEKQFKEEFNCCMCEENKVGKYLNPGQCLRQHGNRAHKMCPNCWWGEFATEGVNHKCPGCVKHLPLSVANTKHTANHQASKPITVIDLTEDDD